MTQTEYDIIVQCIKSGVPALSDSLVLSFNNLVISSNNATKNEVVDNKKTNNSASKKTNKKGEN